MNILRDAFWREKNSCGLKDKTKPKKINVEEVFLDERLMKYAATLSIICGAISMALLYLSHELELLFAFEMVTKLMITILTLLAFSKYHWDAMKGMMGSLLFALLYQEGFFVLGKLWGETADFDAFLVMGVQGSLYLSAQSMTFLMTIIIIINHFVMNYGRWGNVGNVIFNQISIGFKMLLCIFLIVINIFLNLPLLLQINAVFGYFSDLCIIIMLICIETQLDSFKAIKFDLLQNKKENEQP